MTFFRFLQKHNSTSSSMLCQQYHNVFSNFRLFARYRDSIRAAVSQREDYKDSLISCKSHLKDCRSNAILAKNYAKTIADSYASASNCRVGTKHYTSEVLKTQDGVRDSSFNQVKLLLIYICNFHVLSHLLLIYICKLHWNLNTMFVCQVNSF